AETLHERRRPRAENAADHPARHLGDDRRARPRRRARGPPHRARRAGPHGPRGRRPLRAGGRHPSDYVTLRPLDMAAFARSAFARIAKIADREWIFEGGADVTGDGDEQRLTQAVIQLAANAVRYSEPGTPIRFGVDQAAGPDGPEFHIRVQDEGVG